jgi:hypothetical protein
MLFPPRAVERAMQIKEVLLRTMNTENSWLQSAEILGITPRGLRRLRQRMDQFGYEGLVDMRHRRPSPRRTPVAEVEPILEMYRERYPGLLA